MQHLQRMSYGLCHTYCIEQTTDTIAVGRIEDPEESCKTSVTLWETSRVSGITPTATAVLIDEWFMPTPVWWHSIRPQSGRRRSRLTMANHIISARRNEEPWSVLWTFPHCHFKITVDKELTLFQATSDRRFYFIPANRRDDSTFSFSAVARCFLQAYQFSSGPVAVPVQCLAFTLTLGIFTNKDVIQSLKQK